MAQSKRSRWAPFATLGVLATVLVGAATLPAPVGAASGGGVADQQATLAAHNTLRSTVAAAETARLQLNVSIPALTWNAAAAQNAQTWANSQLPVVAGGGDLADNPNLGTLGFGENAYAEFGFGAPDIVRAVNSWASEAPDYNYDTNSCTAVCGHYTQLVWADTTSVGCASATDGNTTVVFCDYAPAGNFTGERPYEGTPINAPANNEIENNQALAQAGGTLTASNVGATKQAGEPNHGGDAGGASIWYVYTVPAAATLAIDTCGSGFDTLLAVYRFTSVSMGSLQLVGGDDDGCGSAGGGGRVQWANTETSSRLVLVAVDGFGGAVGSVQLNWHPITEQAVVPWSTQDAQRLTQVANFLGKTPEQVQRDGVSFIAFLTGLGGQFAPTPWTPTPTGADTTVTATWPAEDLGHIASVTTKYQVSEVDAHRLGVYFLSFLVALGGH